MTQSRGDYKRKHLYEDIKFAQAVRSARSDVHVEINGDTAWLTSRNRTEGWFEGNPLNSEGVELVVLSKISSHWRIWAIHWSSHKEFEMKTVQSSDTRRKRFVLLYYLHSGNATDCDRLG